MPSALTGYHVPYDGNAFGKALVGLGAAVIVSQATQSFPSMEFSAVNKIPFLATSYMPTHNSPTYNSFASISGDYTLSDLSFEQVTTNFYSKLLASQERLGEAFEKVLNENLWDLYES